MVTLNFYDAMRRAGTVKYLLKLSPCFDTGIDGIKNSHSLRNVSAGHIILKSIIDAKLLYGLPDDS